MRVKEVHFNFPNSGAINLRQNGSTGSVITAPEWTDSLPPKPAAYARTAAPSPLKIRARFTSGPPGGMGDVRAIIAASAWARWYLSLVGSSSSLGEVQKRKVAFNSAGESELLDFILPVNLSDVPVGILETMWTWQWRGEDGAWVTFDTTKHLTYILPALPNPPWHRTAVREDDQFLPWTDALDKACLWAAGATSVDGASAAVASKINSLSNQHYDVEARYTYVNSTYRFNLTNYLFDCDNAASFTIDCRGTATTLSTFANLLGADLMPLVIDAPGSSQFQTKLIRPLSAPDDDNGWVTIDWSWHEITALPGTLTDSTGGVIPGGLAADVEVPAALASSLLIVDACVHVDRNVSILPLQMPLGTEGVGGYRDKLMANGSVGSTATPRARRPVY